ncbi:MAG: hypothetical protein JO288_02935 [Hyphomicrobiales bacterium]|nr:hypothetical protein [Hyphomicrobiales bacterium]
MFLLWIAVPAALAVIWLLFRRGGYKRDLLDAPPGPDWTFTGERFVDPSSGVMAEVWTNARSGERAYVRARPGAPDRRAV